MTPRDKAEELVEKMWLKINCNNATSSAKQCALIAVDEILSLCWNGNESALNYWEEVKQEIEKL